MDPLPRPSSNFAPLREAADELGVPVDKSSTPFSSAHFARSALCSASILVISSVAVALSATRAVVLASLMACTNVARPSARSVVSEESNCLSPKFHVSRTDSSSGAFTRSKTGFPSLPCSASCNPCPREAARVRRLVAAVLACVRCSMAVTSSPRVPRSSFAMARATAVTDASTPWSLSVKPATRVSLSVCFLTLPSRVLTLLVSLVIADSWPATVASAVLARSSQLTSSGCPPSSL